MSKHSDVAAGTNDSTDVIRGYHAAITYSWEYSVRRWCSGRQNPKLTAHSPTAPKAACGSAWTVAAAPAWISRTSDSTAATASSPEATSSIRVA